MGDGDGGPRMGRVGEGVGAGKWWEDVTHYNGEQDVQTCVGYLLGAKLLNLLRIRSTTPFFKNHTI